MRNKPRPTPLAQRPWFPAAVFGLVTLGLVLADVAATLAATGDPRCLVVRCVVVK